MVKPRLYATDDADSQNAALWTLKTVLIDALKLLHPYMPFITEEIFCTLQSEEESIMIDVYKRQCLHLPAEHPFWTAKENNGVWEKLSGKEINVTCLDGPALCVSNHQANGETILRSGKIVKGKNDIHGMWNYSTLCFNTKYPWESAPVLEDASMAKGEVEAQQYVPVSYTHLDVYKRQGRNCADERRNMRKGRLV